MTEAPPKLETSAVVVRLRPVIHLTDDQFYEFCQINSDLRIERTAQGELVIMPPAGGGTGRRNYKLVRLFADWEENDGTGVGFDSSTGFILPSGAVRSPDVAWVKRERLAALAAQQKERFLPLCPDFVIELRSPSDSLRATQAKMEEYIQNGAQLGWLIDPEEKRVYIYRPQRQVECLENPVRISGDPVLPGFVLELREIWQIDF